jgi:hypothetical protein
MEDRDYSLPGGSELMSNPTRRVRQPGRTAQGHNPPDCGACNNGAPTGIALQVSGLDGCCFPDLDNVEGWQLTPDAENCGRSQGLNPACFYSFISQQGLGNFEFSAGLSCVADGDGFRVQWDVSISVVDANGALLQTLATGQWQSDLLDSCGDFDCTFPGGGPGGTWTVASTGYCTPGSCSSPTWGLTTGNVDPCPQPAAKNCCCGGTPPRPCYFVCFKQTEGPTCCFAFTDMALCYNSAAGCYTGTTRPGPCGTPISGSLCYSPGDGWTFTWNCGAASQSTPLGSSRSAGALVLSASGLTDTTGCCDSGATFDIEIGKNPRCYQLPPQVGDGSCPHEVLVTIPDFVPDGVNADCEMSGNVGGDYILELEDSNPCSYSILLPSLVSCCPPFGLEVSPIGTRIIAYLTTVGGLPAMKVEVDAGAGEVECVANTWTLVADGPEGFDFCSPNTFSLPSDVNAISNCTACFNAVKFTDNATVAPGACP